MRCQSACNVLIQHCMPVINIPPLFLDLSFPFTLLMANSIENAWWWGSQARGNHGSSTPTSSCFCCGYYRASCYSHGMRGSTSSDWFIVFIHVLLISRIFLNPLFVQKWLETTQEHHIDYQQTDDPRDQYDHKLNDTKITTFKHTVTSWAKLPFFPVYISYVWQDHGVAIT